MRKYRTVVIGAALVGMLALSHATGSYAQLAATCSGASIELAPGAKAQLLYPPSGAGTALPPGGSFPTVEVDSQSDQSVQVSCNGQSVTITAPSGYSVQVASSGMDSGTSNTLTFPANPVGGPRIGGFGVVTFTTSPLSDTSGHSSPITVTYPPGWNLVGAPQGTRLQGTSGQVYTFQAGDTKYETSAANAPLASGVGYWAYFSKSTTITLQPSSKAVFTLPLPAGQFVMVGNPYSVTAVIEGADTVFTYDAQSGMYQQNATLRPGAGAWVYSANGSPITITPASQ